MNAAAQTIRIVAFSAIVPLALLVAPILTGQLIAEYGLKPENVGTYFLFELGGISLASLPALWWMRRFSSRDIAVTAAAVFVLGNLAAHQPSPEVGAFGVAFVYIEPFGGDDLHPFFARHL